MSSQNDIVSEFAVKMNVSEFETPKEFLGERPDQEIRYMWDGGVDDENK